MTNETGKKVNEKGGRAGVQEKGCAESKCVGRTGIVAMAIYLVLLSVALICGLVLFWPSATSAGQAASSAAFRSWTFSMSSEVRLLLIVVLAGALGGQVHALRSLSWFVGNRALVRSWLLFYFLRPFVGATLALVFYFVIRAGFFSLGSTVEQTSVYGFTALATLVGMFSEQATEKLQKVATNLFSKPKPAKDAGPKEKQKGEDKEEDTKPRG